MRLDPRVKELRRVERRYQRAQARVDLLRAERDAAVIWALEEGLSQSQISRALGCTRALVNHIVKGLPARARV